jgi:hypothetical protein
VYNWGDWWGKFKAGTYWGTEAGEDALEGYADTLADPDAAWYEKAAAGTGGFFSALWTPDTYQATATTLIGGAAASEALANRGLATTIKAKPHWHGGGPHGGPHFQIDRFLRGVKGSNAKPVRIPLGPTSWTKPGWWPKGWG